MALNHDTSYQLFLNHAARVDGRLFAGVRTTGIYCRPICSARVPKRENMTFFPTAVAAHSAGFRPCLRCRPETAPRLTPWDIGATPIAAAKIERVLLAKQLITDTRLPFAEIATATGFEGEHSLAATMQSLYGRPLSALRPLRLRNLGTQSAAAGVVLTLAYAPPYDWAALAKFLAARAIPGVEWVDDGGRYHRTIVLDGARGTLTVGKDGEHPRLRIEIDFPRIEALTTIANRVRWMFDLALDPTLVADHLARDSRLQPLLATRPGLRVPRAWDGFELAVRAILGQQITVGAATKLAGKLVAAHGQPLTVANNDKLRYTFPTPQQLVGIDLCALGMPGARAAALAALAAATANDGHLFDQKPSLDAAVIAMRALPGIGEWTAQYIAMRAYGEPDAFPTGDIGLLRALADDDGHRPSVRALQAYADAWRPWRAYAALHLWTAGAATQAPAGLVDTRPLGTIENAAIASA
ncbi:MAG: 3-methyladenine DNA glycosylase 2 [Gammaproteobacteria bacterium]|nr:3-methyladenine DNA glycosylase 2 [Gammaproteobacteria bacterium]